uniref:Phosphatidylethanolamine-binding protein n=1 Tax=Clastoptera arizonana TaxID=38151 RepID=A0A1B6CSA6_9HEMI
MVLGLLYLCLSTVSAGEYVEGIYVPEIYQYSRYRACYGPNFTVYSVPENIVLNHTRCNIYIDKKEFEQQPKVVYTTAVPKELYTIAMIDPVKQYRGHEFYLLWLHVNILGSDLLTGKMKSGDEMMPYRAPSAFVGSGQHRYQIVLYHHGRLVKKDDLQYRRKFRFFEWMGAQRALYLGPISAYQFRVFF